MTTRNVEFDLRDCTDAPVKYGRVICTASGGSAVAGGGVYLGVAKIVVVEPDGVKVSPLATDVLIYVQLPGVAEVKEILVPSTSNTTVKLSTLLLGSSTPADTVTGLIDDAIAVHNADPAAHPGLTGGSSPNTPSAGEKAALAGTNGTPGNANRYVTDTDARNTNARTPTAHSHTVSNISDFAAGVAFYESVKSVNGELPDVDGNITITASGGIQLQATTPGTQETGNGNISGKMIADGGFETDGMQFLYDGNVNLILGSGSLSGSASTKVGAGAACLGSQCVVIGYAAAAFDDYCVSAGFAARADCGNAVGYRASSEVPGDVGFTARNLDTARIVLQRGSVSPYGSNKHLAFLSASQHTGTLGKVVLGAFDGLTEFPGIEIRAGSGAESEICFFEGGTPQAKGTITGSRASGAALVSLLDYLESLNLIVDSTTT